MENPQLPPDFKEFLHFCLDREVRFLVIGGMAVIHYGYPRLTLDLDLWIEPTEKNGKKIIEALRILDSKIQRSHLSISARNDKFFVWVSSLQL